MPVSPSVDPSRLLAISDEVRALLGPAMVKRIRRDMAEDVDCYRCGLRVETGTVMSVVVALLETDETSEEMVVVLTHPACSSSMVKRVPLTAREEVPAWARSESSHLVAVSLYRRSAPIRAAFAWGLPAALARTPGGDIVEVGTERLLADGLVRVESFAAFGAPAPGWSLVVGKSAINVYWPSGAQAAQTPLQASPVGPWIEAIAEQRRCLLLTGPRLCRREDGPKEAAARIVRLIESGLVVGGVVDAFIDPE